MNHAYRLLWNDRLRAWIAAPEHARTRGKRGGRSTAVAVAIAALAATPLRAAPLDANALPVGARVTAGTARVSQAGSRMDVTQGTDRAILEWRSFDIGANAEVRFTQPSASAVALNRVVAGDATRILGSLSANGQVWVVNPAGVIFGTGSRVDVGGLVASTLDVRDEDFIAGRAVFSRNGATGKVVNQGTLTTADGGLIALLAPEVRNEGVISARLGNVALAAGERVTLEAGAAGRLRVAVDPAAVATLVENRHLIEADGGQVLMSAKAADALLSAVVANGGTVRARTLADRDGRILLLADMEHGRVDVAGTLDASAPGGGNGGFVETSAARVKIADGTRVTTLAPNGQTGTWLIDPQDYTIAASGGDITGATLSSNLSGGPVTIQSTSGGTAGNGDIFVNDAVTWSANKLTLSAVRNIGINANLNGSGTAQLALEYGAANDYTLSGGAKISLPAGANFSTKLGAGGATTWTVITSLGVQGDATVAPGVMSLQGMNTNLAGNYVLGADINASDTSNNWNGGTGFTPVGSLLSPFTGKFDGLGHTITGLTINRPNIADYQGLFGGADNATLRNVGLLNSNIKGRLLVGTLLGWGNSVTVSYSYANGGSVYATQNAAGGLVGGTSVSIDHSYANVSVTSEGDSGGGPGSGNSLAGGLIGASSGNISYSYATGSVTGHGPRTGGLAGSQSAGTISTSYATGAVSGTTEKGGMVGGQTGGTVANTSYWDKSTTHQDSGVGAVGGTNNSTGLTTGQWVINGPLSASPAGGAWSSADWGSGYPYPGLKALPYITITASASQTYGSAPSFAIASILNQNGANAAGLVNTGGLAWQAGTDAASAAGTTASVRGSGATATGYQILYAGSVTVQQAPLTVTANGASKTYDGLAWSGGNGVAYTGFANGETAGVLGGTLSYGGSAQGAVGAGSYAIAPSGLSAANYAINYVNGTLNIAKAPLTVTAGSRSKTYDGLAWSGGTDVAYAGFVNGEKTSALSGTLVYGGTWQGAINAGSYVIAPSGLSSGNYAISYVNGTLDIAKAPLTVTAGSRSKTYDGLAWSGDSSVSYAGFVNGETTSALGGTLAWGGSAQGAKNAGSYAIAPSGWTSNNYRIAYVDGTLTIAQAPLTVTALDANKLYDARPYAGGNGVSYTGFVNGETPAVLGGTLGYIGSSQGATAVGSYIVTPTGLSSGNYHLTYVDGTLGIDAPPIDGASLARFPRMAYEAAARLASLDGVLSFQSNFIRMPGE